MCARTIPPSWGTTQTFSFYSSLILQQGFLKNLYSSAQLNPSIIDVRVMHYLYKDLDFVKLLDFVTSELKSVKIFELGKVLQFSC